MKKNMIEELERNIISWYDFKENSKILYWGKKEDEIYKFLKENNKKVDIAVKDKIYDYIIIIENELNIDEILETTKYLAEDGIMLLAFNNEYGISKFTSYDFVNRETSLEDSKYKLPNIIKVKEILKEKGFDYSNLYMPFPNAKRTDVILTSEIQNIDDKLDKYFVQYKENEAIITDEIKLLRRISKYNKEMFVNLANSYLLEISKRAIQTDVKYVSFNNYRKKEYRLITIIREDRVEKKAATWEAKGNIDKIVKNLNILENQYGKDFEILDKFSNNTLYSKYIKDNKTLDVLLGENFDNEEYVIKILNDLKENLLENSLQYNKDDRKKYISVLKDEDENILKKLNFLVYAFYDMVPKNCFLIDNKFYFFDQEWMEKYLPVEFIIYRSIINSYDLIRKINVDDLLEKMGLLEFKGLFEKIDCYFRKKIIDTEMLENLDKKYPKMYEVLYEKEVLKMQNEDYRQNDIKQNEYIKSLESKLQKK